MLNLKKANSLSHYKGFAQRDIFFTAVNQKYDFVLRNMESIFQREKQKNKKALLKDKQEMR